MSEILYDGQLELRMHDYRGLSAYEIAVRNGFEGTEAEWLESLKGQPGADGDALTVNNVEPQDGNINLYSTDIKVQRGSVVTVQQKLEELAEDAKGYLTAADIVNDVETGGTGKALSAEQGKNLFRTKAYGFSASVEIPMGNWSGEGPYTRDVDLAGVSANAELCQVLMCRNPEYKEQFNACAVELIGQKTDALTFRVEEIPEAGFPVNVLVIFTGVEEEASE